MLKTIIDLISPKGKFILTKRALLVNPQTPCYNCLQMTFDEKVKFLRALPDLKVAPISEVRAIAFAAREIDKLNVDSAALGQTKNGVLTLSEQDIKKILREYPDLEIKLTSV